MKTRWRSLSFGGTSQGRTVDLPFHDSHPQFRLPNTNEDGGGMISFIMKAGREAAIKVVETYQIFTLAESLGGVEFADRGPCRDD